jgi:hypothetical protein
MMVASEGTNYAARGSTSEGGAAHFNLPCHCAISLLEGPTLARRFIMRMHKTIMLVAPLAVALSLATTARAEVGAAPCRQDVEKLCPDAKPGGGALRGCLERHASELSPACQDHLKQMTAKVRAWRQACQDDVQEFCAGIQPGGGNLLRCLRQHQDQLSKTCQEQTEQAQQNWHRHTKSATGSNAP